MKTTLDIQVRAFPVRIHDHSAGTERAETIVLTKEHLQAAQLVGQSSKELIHRICERAGCSVLEIGKPEHRTVSLNLEELYKAYSLHQLGKREKVEV
ncbi:hypothetical protein [Pseudoflavonifractor sp. HCP28S3_F10]|uniref:hypothetical protein n=1 Tax=Pseudoflavonifractor sp. HCP28S3_F10 TaxID=3438947 RepID=UPI003F8BA686